MYYLIIALLTIAAVAGTCLGITFILDSVLDRKAAIWNKYNFYK